MTARAVRLGIPLAALALVAALRPEIVRGTFSSAESALRVAAVVAAWLAFSWVVHRYVHQPVARTAIVTVAGAGLLWFTVVPYFQEKTVDDAFPVATPTTVAEAVATSDSPVAATPPVAAPAAPTGPVKQSSGQLRGLAGHRGSGEAALYRQPDGSLLVRLEGFDVSNVPSPVVYLVPGAGKDSPGGVKLGALRGSQGNQNFAVPSGTDVAGAQTVLIWCEAFSVPVAGATAQN